MVDYQLFILKNGTQIIYDFYDELRYFIKIQIIFNQINQLNHRLKITTILYPKNPICSILRLGQNIIRLFSNALLQLLR